MRVNLIITLSTCLFLLACTANYSNVTPQEMPFSPTQISPSITAQVDLVSPTPTSQPTQNPTALPSPTPLATSEYIYSADLSSFAAAWSSHDDSRIRALYTEDARYFTDEEIMNLKNELPIDVLVVEDGFEKQVEKYTGYTMRILGTPIKIFDKLVAFAYRWENETEGNNGMALLRYEEDKILLHTDLVSDQPTTNQPDQTSYFVDPKNLDSLMQAWNEADLASAQALYADQAAVLSDEDLAQAPWRDFYSPPDIGDLLNMFAGWNPAVLGQPLQIGDQMIFAWRWYDKDYPVGYGIRLLQYDDERIVRDIRYVIRPWEASGQAFMNP